MARLLHRMSIPSPQELILATSTTIWRAFVKLFGGSYPVATDRGNAMKDTKVFDVSKAATDQKVQRFEKRLDAVACEVAGRFYRGNVCGQFNAVLSASALEAEREELRNKKVPA